MSAERPLLILDLDETLIFGAETPNDQPADFRAGPFHVYRRPFLAEFLRQAGEWFELAVWTSASAGYAEIVCNNVFSDVTELRFLWSMERCTQRRDPESFETIWLKDLAKVKRLGYSLPQVLIIDDSPEKLSRHYGNLIRVRPYLGDRQDSELLELLPFLSWLRSADDFRRVEKRAWRSFNARQ